MKDKFYSKVITILSLLFFLQVIAPFTKEGLFLGHDSQLHLIYLKHFEEAFRAGQIPTRLIDWFVPGFNQPLFNYYQPGVNYFYLIPRFLGFSYTLSLDILVISLWLLSALLMFLFSRRHFGNLAAILVAYLYLIAPYHILDILIRAALPEFTALSFIPGVFWALKSYFDTKRGLYLTLISAFIALVTISHPPTTFMFSPFILLYIFYNLISQKSFRLVLPVLISIVVGFGIISFFLTPALLEQQYIRIIYMKTGYYDFEHHFVCPQQLFKTFWAHGTSLSGCDDGMSFQLGLVHWLVVLGASIILIARISIKKYAENNYLDLGKIGTNKLILLIICLGLIIAYIYLMFEISKPIWDSLPYIAYIQYSWRFLAPTIFLASFSAGFILLVIKNEKAKYATFVVLMLAAGIAYKNYLKPIAYAEKEEVNFGNVILRESVTGIKNLYPEPGYMPKRTEILPAENDRPKEEVRYATEEAKLNDYKLTAANKAYHFTAANDTIARFYTHYFPGWEVAVDNQKVEPNYNNIYGYMDVLIPAGDHRVTLTFKNTKTRSLANILSVNFTIAAIGLAFVFNRKKKA